jgi:Ser/Thr protein kinase RdoA (MazF antagonist)
VSADATRAFQDLTLRGQLRRLRSLALDALHAYDFEVRRCSFAARAFNTVFRVDATNGSTYAVRMSPSLRIHADGCEEAEAAWVTALRRDAGVATPAVIAATDGSVVVWAEVAGVPAPRSCVLFDWVRGRPLRERLTAERVRKTGAVTAVVHEHGATYAPSGGAGPPAGVIVADRVLSFRTAPRLEELRPTFGSLLADAVARAQRALDELWKNPPHAPHLLHGDVQPSNVMVTRDEVVLIDFQDLIWGFEVQDVTIALLGLEHVGDTGALSDAFRAGYEAVRAWPDAHPETLAALRAARHLQVLDLGLNIRRPGLDDFIARNAAPIAEWMGNQVGGKR